MTRRGSHPASRPRSADRKATGRGRKRTEPEPPPAEPDEAPPERCPRCRSEVLLVPRTPTGLRPWTCRRCRVIGYGQRVIGEPIPAVLPAPKRGRRTHDGYTFIRRPRPGTVDDDYARTDEASGSPAQEGEG